MLELLVRWANEHIAHEESMIGAGADDSNVDPVSFIPAGEAIDDIYSVPGIQIVNGALSVDFPHLQKSSLLASKSELESTCPKGK